MGLLDKLTQQGSTLTKHNGTTPSKDDAIIPLNPDTFVSQLDLDGKTPSKYTDNLPE
jgi:hypothetical protein